jgi:LysM repeat protein
MEFSSISNKIKDKLNEGADKFLSTRVKEELGFSKPTIDSLYNLSEDQNIEENLNNFYKPINSTFLSQRQYKKIKNWALVLITVVSVLLVILFVSMVVPHQNFKDQINGAQIFVNGDKVIKPEDKIAEAKLEDDNKNQESDLEVKDINVSREDATEELAKTSPLLKEPEPEPIPTKPKSSSSANKHKIQSGDTLEKIALKYFGASTPKEIDRIKVANKIRDVRLLRIGQEIIIPAN